MFENENNDLLDKIVESVADYMILDEFEIAEKLDELKAC